MKPDVFISYAYHDGSAVAEPLAHALDERGYGVWYDGFSIRPGDSIREKIEAGLAGCSFGAVILSPAFFASRYTSKELDGLYAREASEQSVLVVPIRHGMTHDELVHRAPTLAGRHALSTDDGIPALVEELARVLGSPSRQEAPEAGVPRDGRSRVEVLLEKGFPDLYTVQEAFHTQPPPPNQVFAIELLTRALRLERLRNDRIRLTVDREGTTHAVVTTPGKKALCDRFLTSDTLHRGPRAGPRDRPVPAPRERPGYAAHSAGPVAAAVGLGRRAVGGAVARAQVDPVLLQGHPAVRVEPFPRLVRARR